MMTGQGAHKIVSAVIGPKGPVLALSPNSIGALVEGSFWVLDFDRPSRMPLRFEILNLNKMHE